MLPELFKLTGYLARLVRVNYKEKMEPSALWTLSAPDHERKFARQPGLIWFAVALSNMFAYATFLRLSVS